MINIIHIYSGVVTPNLFIKPQSLYTKSSPLAKNAWAEHTLFSAQ